MADSSTQPSHPRRSEPISKPAGLHLKKRLRLSHVWGPAQFTRLDRQTGLGAVERLDLRFLVDREHHGMGWRMHVETDDIFHLLGESRVAGALEGAQAMRLQAGWGAGNVVGGQAPAGGFGPRAAGPVGPFAGPGPP